MAGAAEPAVPSGFFIMMAMMDGGLRQNVFVRDQKTRRVLRDGLKHIRDVQVSHAAGARQALIKVA